MSFVDNTRLYNSGAAGKSEVVAKCDNCALQTSAIAPYSGWSSWKNNISGNFNRRLCDTCKDSSCNAILPNAPGVYPVNRVAVKVEAEALSRQPEPVRRCVKNPKNYSYLDYPGRLEQGTPYKPVEYTRGFWPDEYLNTFNHPDPYNGISLDAKLRYLSKIQSRPHCPFSKQIAINAGAYSGTFPRRDPFGNIISKW